MSETKTKRPPFEQRLLKAAAEVAEWARGERTLLTTEKVNGERITIEETGPEFVARRVRQEAEPIRYDPTVDALYIDLSKADVEDTREIKSGILLDYDQAGNVIGVEILDFMERLKRQENKTEEAA